MFKIKNLAFSLSVFFIAIMANGLVYADTVYTVRSTDNLSRIVDRFYQGRELSRSQIFLGILEENPGAFKGGNINFLMRGKRLNLPDENKFSYISDEDAKELLAEHVRFYRNGLTGDFKPPFSDENSRVDNSRALEINQVAQTSKISQLEKESEELRARLEKLVAEKTASDQKLLEIEEALKNSVGQASGAGRDLNTNSAKNPELLEAKKKLSEKIKLKTQELQESNSLLQQKLQESKSELAETTRTTVLLEHQLSKLQNKQNQDSNPDAVAEVSNMSAENDTGVKGIDNTQMTFKESGLMSTYLWPALALLLALLGLLTWRWSRKKQMAADDNLTQAVEKTYLAENSFLEAADYQEEPLEASIKLDVANAYIEAHDTDSAHYILREVLAEGNEEQQKQAQNMLATLQ